MSPAEDLLQRILSSDDPSGPMAEIACQGSILQRLNQNIFSSLFSTYVTDRPESWDAQAAETALQLLSKEEGNRYARDSLLEIAFHANLASLNTPAFYRNVSRIEDVLQSLDQQGLSRSSQYVKGLLAYARDDLEAAERAFSTLPDILDAPLLASQSGYAAFRAPGFYRTLLNYDPPIGLNFLQRPPHSSDISTVLLCSADALYFEAFAEDFMAQVFDVSSSVHIHFHLINTPDAVRVSNKALLTSDRVSVTSEQTDLPDPGRYTIMSRYIILPLVMREWGRPVLVSDIDLSVRNDPAKLDVSHPVTLGFSHIPAAAYIPAVSIQGGHNLFQPNEAGLEFAKVLSRYLHYMCANQRGLWAADQVALLMVWRMLRRVIAIGDFRDVRGYSYGPSPDRMLKKKAAGDRLRKRSRAGS